MAHGRTITPPFGLLVCLGLPGGAQHVLADLARGSPRQLVHQRHHLGGLLPGGSGRGEVLPGLLDIEGEPGAGDDHRADALAERRVGHRDDRHVRHRGVGDQQVLDLLGRDVLPAADDDVLEPVGDREVPAGVDPADVPGAEPAAGQERGLVQRLVGVAGEQLGAAGEDLARLPVRHVAAVGVDQADLVAGEQAAVGLGPQAERVGDGARGHRRVLAAAVGAERGDSRGVGAPDQARRDRGRAGQELAQRAEAGGAACLPVEQAGQLDRRPAARGDGVPVDERGGQGGIPRLHDHGGRAKQQDAQQAEQPGHVPGREQPQVPGAGAVERVHRGGCLGQQGPVRMLHALGLGRGARGVHEHRALAGVGVRLTVRTARRGEQPGIANRAVPGGTVTGSAARPSATTASFSAGRPGQPAEHDVGVRAATVLAGQDDRGGARTAQQQVHLPGAVDHHHRQQDGSAEGDGRLDHRSLVGAWQLDRDHVAAADAAGLQRSCGLLRVAHQGAQRRGALAVARREHQRAAVVDGGAGPDVRGERREVHR